MKILAPRWFFFLLMIGIAFTSKSGRATIPIVEGDEFGLSLSGYLRSLSGLEHFGYDTAGLLEENVGLNIEVLRLEWQANLGRHVTLEVHDRFLWRLMSSTGGLEEGALGIGVSTPPQRWIDLESTLLEEDNLLLTHDVDRLMVRLYLDQCDITLGRQAITWGVTKIFPVADLWTQFSPFELDTSEKRGIDALRAMTSPSDVMELDFILADRGTLDDLSGGARMVLYLQHLDFYLAGGKLSNQIMLMGGLTADLEEIGLYLDAAWDYDYDQEELGLPRITTGIDVYAVSDLFVTLEYHFNGLGADSSDEYLTRYTADSFQRGETYLVGQHYAGLLVSYLATELVTLNLSTIANLQDPSIIIAPGVSYNVSTDVDISLGGYLAIGEDPELGMPPAVQSEFGIYPDMGFVHMAAFY